MPATAYIALGSNLGKRQLALRSAMGRIAALPNSALGPVSNFVETVPVGGPPDQPLYLNAALAIDTALPPAELLGQLLAIERDLGRDRSVEPRYGPRIIDLDLLLYGEAVLNTPDLTVPHPRMHERRFVLEPLAQIAPEAVHPVLRRTVRELLDALPA